jgi:hypothetical protein
MGKKLNEIDRDVCRTLSADVVKLLKPLEAKYGVKVRTTGGKFDPMRFTLPVDISIATKDGESAADKERFELFCGAFDLKKSDYSKVVRDDLKNRDLRIVGINTRRSRFPIILEDVIDDRRIMASAEWVQRMLRAQK